MTDLAQLLNAKRAAIDSVPSNEEEESLTQAEMQAEADPIVVSSHGEILPASPAPTPPVVEYAPQYPSIPPKVVGGLPYVRDYMKLARTIHSTEMVPKVLQGRPDAILACFMQGYELGLGPMQALNGINIIQGRPSLSAELMRALIIQAGHVMILSQTNDVATIRCHRREWPAGEMATFEFTIEDARRAGLVEWHERWTKNQSGKNFKQVWNPHSTDPKPAWAEASNLKKSDAWHNYTRAMLGARVSSECARATFADVLAGMSYTPEEIRDFSGDDREEQPSSTAAVPSPPATVQVAENSTPSESSSDSNLTGSTPAAPEPSENSTPSSPPKATRARKAAHAAPSPLTDDSTTQTAQSTEDSPETSPAGSDVRLEMRKGLTAVIAGLPAPQQPLVRAYLAQQGYGDVTKLTEIQIQEAIDIAAGWPDSIVVDAEIVPTAQELADEFEQQQF